MRGEPSVHTVSSLPQNVFKASKFRERSLRENMSRLCYGLMDSSSSFMMNWLSSLNIIFHSPAVKSRSVKLRKTWVSNRSHSTSDFIFNSWPTLNLPWDMQECSWGEKKLTGHFYTLIIIVSCLREFSSQLKISFGLEIMHTFCMVW